MMDFDVTSEADLLVAERPDVHVVNWVHACNSLKIILDLVTVDIIGDGLEDEQHALPEGLTRRP